MKFNDAHDLRGWEILNLHNEACRELGYFDDEILEMDFFIETHFSQVSTSLLSRVCHSEFNPYDEYVYFDGCSYISFDYASDYINYDIIQEYLERDD